MSKYNYYEAVHDDVAWTVFGKYNNEQIVTNLRNDEEKFKEILHDDLFSEDFVTGNGSGSYTMNRAKAEENVNHNWDLFSEALNNFNDSFDNYIYGDTLNFEKIDVVIRCYLLRDAVNIVVDELKEEFKEEL